MKRVSSWGTHTASSPGRRAGKGARYRNIQGIETARGTSAPPASSTRPRYYTHFAQGMPGQ